MQPKIAYLTSSLNSSWLSEISFKVIKPYEQPVRSTCQMRNAAIMLLKVVMRSLNRKNKNMQDILSMAEAINRPKLLVRAARFGLGTYQRATILQRMLPGAPHQKSKQIVLHLLELEADINDQRLHKAADYSANRHIVLLTALMAETQRIRSQATSLPC